MIQPYGGKILTVVIVIAAVLLIGFEVYDYQYYTDAPDTVEVPIVLDLSGDRSEEGQAYLRGIEIAMDDINSAGGRQFVPVIYDTEGSIDVMERCFEDIKSKGYTFMLGPMYAEEARSVALSDYDICALTFSVSVTSFSAYHQLYRNMMTDEQFANAICNYLKNGYKSVAVLYNGSFESLCMLDDLMLKLDGMGLDVQQISVDDPAVAVDKMIENPSDVVVSLLPVASGLEEVLLLSQERGLNAKWLGLDSSVNDEVASIMDGFYAITTQRTITEGSFVDKYIDKYGGSPDPKAMYGYDFMTLLAQVVNADGVSFDRVVQGLSLIRYIGMTGFIKFNENGDCYSSPNIVVSDDGEWKTLSWKDILDL